MTAINQVRERVSTKRLTINFGKFGIADFFDQNAVSHDPRTDFMNWSLMNNGAYDYAANTRGYTGGLIVEYYTPGWVLRAGTALDADLCKWTYLNFNWAKSNSETSEIQKDYTVHELTRNRADCFFITIHPKPPHIKQLSMKIKMAQILP